MLRDLLLIKQSNPIGSLSTKGTFLTLVDEYLEKTARGHIARNLIHRNAKILSPTRNQIAANFNNIARQQQQLPDATTRRLLPLYDKTMVARLSNRPAPSLRELLQASAHRPRMMVSSALSPLANKIVAKDREINIGLWNARNNIQEWATRPLSRQAESIRRNAIEGMQYSGGLVPHTGISIPGMVAGKYAPNPGINATSPFWYWNKLSKPPQ